MARMKFSVQAKFALGVLLGAALHWVCGPAAAQTISGSFSANYNVILNTSVGGVPANYGGVAFLNSDTLLLGGQANSTDADIYAVQVNRGSGGHITGFGPVTSLADAFGGSLAAPAGGIDGGLVIAPNGTILYTTFSSNDLGQVAPSRFRPGGSGIPNRIDPLIGVGASVGTLQFVPAGFGAASGKLKVASFNTGDWHDVTLTDDGSGNGTFNISVGPTVATTAGGPEGIVYVEGGNPGIALNSVLVSEFSANRVSLYQVDANGNPITATRQDFVNGLSGALGGTRDPVTGDFVFSTFGGSANRVVVVGGFQAPTSVVPEPASLLLFMPGLAAVALLRRRRK